ncbi:MAG TPA: tetratricopeptide repeat protein [Terriglobales bacterium]|nr:tetratricopeptide repeat protein [Terriglobales bacterium]
MKLIGKFAVPLICVALICGAAIGWRLVKARVTERKLTEAAKACRLRAEQGDANAQHELAGMFYRGKGVPQDYAEAVVWDRKAADQGNPKAQYGLGFMYDVGKGVPQDYNEAVSWFRKAAQQGYARAQYALGNEYYAGKNVPLNYTEAAGWYHKAADQSYAEAQYALGYMYYEGREVPQDDSEAAAWYRKAADQGYARAQSALGYMYFQGRGVQRNYAEAARWYRKAAKQGDEYSRHALAAMKIGFDTPDKVLLSLGFLGSVLLLIFSRGDIRNPKQRRVAIGGLLGVLRVGLDVYGRSHFGMLQALSAVNVFYFGRSLLSGIFGAVLLPVVWPKGFKIVLTICAMLFIGFNVYAMTHYNLRRFAACPRAFYSANGLLMGIAITSAFHLWLAEKSRGAQNGNDRVATGTVAGKE